MPICTAKRTRVLATLPDACNIHGTVRKLTDYCAHLRQKYSIVRAPSPTVPRVVNTVVLSVCWISTDRTCAVPFACALSEQAFRRRHPTDRRPTRWLIAMLNASCLIVPLVREGCNNLCTSLAFVDVSWKASCRCMWVVSDPCHLPHTTCRQTALSKTGSVVFVIAYMMESLLSALLAF